MKFAEKVVVVTGGGNGIGRQLVLELLRRGAEVAAVDVREHSLRETADLAEAGDRLTLHSLDISHEGIVHALPDQVIEKHGAVDGLINNAGIIHDFARFNDLSYEAIGRVVNVNLWGTIHMVKAFLPHLLTRPAAHIANLSSMGALAPVPGQSMYGATKAAIKLLTEGLYAELLDTNVGVSVIMPGAIGTDITGNSGVEPPIDVDSIDPNDYPMTSPEDAAQIILDGIEANKLHIHVGRDASMLGLASRIAPKRAAHLIYNRMKDIIPA